MTSILLKKIVRLGRDEDGAALIVTLALFMFMYLSCAGIFAIGQTAKNRIHLQNACDAAAYSAAVVQADTLSRIATINRAMSWTYISMSQRQMDYIVWKWLDHTKTHVYEDAQNVIDSGDPGQHFHPFWYVGGLDIPVGTAGYNIRDKHLSTLKANGSIKSILQVEGAIDGFRFTHLPAKAESFYSSVATTDGLKLQIDDDKTTILAMNDKIKDLADQMPDRVKDAARDVLRANVRFAAERGCWMFLKQSDHPRGDYMRMLGDGSTSLTSDELRFLAFSDYFPSRADKPFGSGSSEAEWFPLHGGGIKRSYVQRTNLFTEWYSWSCRWICSDLVPCFFMPTTPGCPHDCRDCNSSPCDKCRGDVTGRHAYLRAGHLRPDNYNGRDLFDGVQAKPLILRDAYFGEEGTITVGLACYNENPWYRIFKSSAGIGKGILGGIFGAFNPYKYMEWSWAFSSAKAGYKFIRGDAGYSQDDDDINSRSYVVDWRDGNWNLSQSDLDAVFVPVRRACSKAEAGAWYGDVPPLDSWVLSGDWQPLEGSGSSAYAVSSMPDLPGMLGNASGIKWNRVAEMLYH